MDPTLIAAIAVAAIGGIFGFVGARYSRRKEKADAASTLIDSALQLIGPLRVEIGVLSKRVDQTDETNARLVTRVATLEVANRTLHAENDRLRTRITVLEHQLVDLGHTPVNGAAVITTSTTEVVKTVTQGDN